jgi:hypothetical protein
MDFRAQWRGLPLPQCKNNEKLPPEIKSLIALQRVSTSFCVKNVLRFYQSWPS